MAERLTGEGGISLIEILKFAMYKKIIGAAVSWLCISGGMAAAQNLISSGFPELDRWAEECIERRSLSLGYPGNNDIHLQEFYGWYTANNLEAMIINNAGDPFAEGDHTLSSLDFEREVIEYFAPKYGFDRDDSWGLVTMSGTDGNNHGIYFGVNYLKGLTGRMPVVYVSDEAHYSNFRLCDLQHLDVRLVRSDPMGRMIPDSLEAALDTSRPCLMVYAMGSTLKGAIDDQKALNVVLARHKEMAVYRHVDAALFGGYLPFTEYREMVDRRKMEFESISVSGHKFFGIDSPCGIFLTTRKVYENQATFDVPYLNANMRMINCSRSGIEPLKFWWLIKTVGDEGWAEQARMIMENTEYLKAELGRIGWPRWNNDRSNTVLFRRPSDAVVRKYNLACGYDEAFGGAVSHVVVMQHVTRESIDELISDLEKE